MTLLDTLYTYVGGDKYTAASICMTSDYVLVNTFTVLRLVIATCSFVLALLFALCYTNGVYLMRMSVTLLKDPWIVKLLGLTFFITGLNQVVATLIIHYSIYYLQAAMLVVMTITFFYATLALAKIALNQQRQKSILSAFLDTQAPVADYHQGVVASNGIYHPLETPLPIGSKPSIPGNTEKE